MRVRGFLVFGLALLACGSDEVVSRAPRRSCEHVIWHKPASRAAHVEVVGSWNGWARPGQPLDPVRTDGWRALALSLPAGEHSYAIVEDGEWLTDARVPTTSEVQGREVTWLNIDSCERPALHVDAVEVANGRATVRASFLAARTGEPLDPGSLKVKRRDASLGMPEFTVDAAPSRGAVTIEWSGLARGKHTFVLSASDRSGRATEEVLATAWVEPRATDLRDFTVYQIVVDRFRRESGPVAQPELASARAGGTVMGVRRALESGEFEQLGVNAIWLSPLYRNPSGLYPGSDGRSYSSYHGYWPVDSRATDPVSAPEVEIDRLIEAAHARGIRIVFDVVPNHVHEDHPYVREHKADGWFNRASGDCICGTDRCPWDKTIQECWFAPYMPDLDWRLPEVANQVTSDVVWWLDRFDGDGLRIDAVPMMPRSATRRIVHAVRSRFDQPGGHESLLLGENFTGPGGYSLLRYQLGPHGLNGQFHFPLMWAIRSAIAEEAQSLFAIDEAFRAGEREWAGSGAVMGLMVGNHDVTRFASVSAGDADGDGWTPAARAESPAVYAKQKLALGLVLTMPGMPVLYYGDEIALAGRRDPDSRRVMPSEAELTPQQRALRAAVQVLGRTRACAASLRRGSYSTLLVEDEVLVFQRQSPGEAPVVVALTREAGHAVDVPLPADAPLRWRDVLSGEELDVSSPSAAQRRLTLTHRGPFSLRVLVPSTSRCARP